MTSRVHFRPVFMPPCKSSKWNLYPSLRHFFFFYTSGLAYSSLMVIHNYLTSFLLAPASLPFGDILQTAMMFVISIYLFRYLGKNEDTARERERERERESNKLSCLNHFNRRGQLDGEPVNSLQRNAHGNRLSIIESNRIYFRR